ncbi:ATP-binding protein [Pelagibius sp. 7325]|uniref:GAF domain-containing sensor histidine kinase n=1 Tax=Pelagibius sp. 7325 TaxID=3131994 RepID=UPI0030EE37C8
MNLLAEIMQVPAALITRVDPPNLKVCISSESKGNPYKPDGVAPLDQTYCQTVMTTRQPLHVADAVKGNEWQLDPSVTLGMISYLGVPITWPDGEIFGTICVFDNRRNEYSDLYLRLLLQWRDVLQDDLKTLSTLHRQLEERDAKIRRLVDANIIGIYIWDFAGHILEANDAFLRIVGYDRDDLRSGRLRWSDLTPPEWLDRDLARWLPELKTAGSLQPFEKEFLRQDGSHVPVMIGAACFEDGGSEGVAFVLDLTERQRATEALREVQAELAHVNRIATVGQLTASIAHEINQPLGAIVIDASNSLRHLSGERPDLQKARNAIERIASDGERAVNVIRSLRALAQKGGPNITEVDIRDAIEEVLMLTLSERHRHRVELRTMLATEDRLVLGDRVQIQQVMLNLIMNSIEAMSTVMDRPRVLEVSAALCESDGLLLVIEDTGSGLGPDIANRIFEPFFTTKPNGMGMGLSICRSIVEAHGGRFWGSRRAPHGATFKFTLPRLVAESAVMTK